MLLISRAAVQGGHLSRAAATLTARGLGSAPSSANCSVVDGAPDLVQQYTRSANARTLLAALRNQRSPITGPRRAAAAAAIALLRHPSPAVRCFAGDAAPAAPNGHVISFPLAQTGEGISECELVAWHVKVGLPFLIRLPCYCLLLGAWRLLPWARTMHPCTPL